MRSTFRGRTALYAAASLCLVSFVLRSVCPLSALRPNRSGPPRHRGHRPRVRAGAVDSLVPMRLDRGGRLCVVATEHHRGLVHDAGDALRSAHSAGFALLGRGFERDAKPFMVGLSGAVFGLAALTRSMPIYFMLPAALLGLIVAQDRSRAWRGVTALLVGFGLMTVPYSIALSIHLGEPTFIENHGGLRIISHYGGSTGTRPAGMVGTATVLLRAFVDSPGEMVSTLGRRSLDLFSM